MEIIGSLNNSIYRFKYLYMGKMISNLDTFRKTNSIKYADNTIEFAKSLSTLITDHTKYMNIRGTVDLHSHLVTFEKFVSDSAKNNIYPTDIYKYQFDVIGHSCDMTNIIEYLKDVDIRIADKRTDIYDVCANTISIFTKYNGFDSSTEYIDMKDIRTCLHILNNPLDDNIPRYMQNYYTEISSVIEYIEGVIHNTSDNKIIEAYLDIMITFLRCVSLDIYNLFFYIHHRHNSIVSILQDIINRKEVRK